MIDVHDKNKAPNKHIGLDHLLVTFGPLVGHVLATTQSLMLCIEETGFASTGKCQNNIKLLNTKDFWKVNMAGKEEF